MIKKMLGVSAIGLLMASCTIGHQITVTNNAVGTKTGVAKGTSFSKDRDISIEAACKDGGITKVGTMEYKVTSILFFAKYELVVTGE